MKTLLRHTRTGLYFQGPDKWTSNPQSAYDFRFVDRALQYVEIWELKQVELAFSFEDPHSVTMVSCDKTALHFVAA
jgi:hypothetical protein